MSKSGMLKCKSDYRNSLMLLWSGFRRLNQGFLLNPKDILRSTNSLGKEQLTQEEKEQYRQRRREALADFKDTLSRQRESFYAVPFEYNEQYSVY